MTKDKQKDIAEMINILKELNPASFVLVQSSAQVLLARDRMGDKQEDHREFVGMN